MRLITLILTLIVLVGCGSKGSLFLPKHEAAPAQPVAQEPDGKAEQPAKDKKEVKS